MNWQNDPELKRIIQGMDPKDARILLRKLSRERYSKKTQRRKESVLEQIQWRCWQCGETKPSPVHWPLDLERVPRCMVCTRFVVYETESLLEERRLSLGVSREALARAAQIATRTLKRIEEGRGSPLNREAVLGALRAIGEAQRPRFHHTASVLGLEEESEDLFKKVVYNRSRLS